jgi:hypothetical protein
VGLGLGVAGVRSPRPAGRRRRGPGASGSIQNRAGLHHDIHWHPTRGLAALASDDATGPYAARSPELRECACSAVRFRNFCVHFEVAVPVTVDCANWCTQTHRVHTGLPLAGRQAECQWQCALSLSVLYAASSSSASVPVPNGGTAHGGAIPALGGPRQRSLVECEIHGKERRHGVPES